MGSYHPNISSQSYQTGITYHPNGFILLLTLGWYTRYFHHHSSEVTTWLRLADPRLAATTRQEWAAMVLSCWAMCREFTQETTSLCMGISYHVDMIHMIFIYIYIYKQYICVCVRQKNGIEGSTTPYMASLIWKWWQNHWIWATLFHTNPNFD